MTPPPRKEPPKISEAEWQVMGVLWDCSPATSSEIVQALEGTTGWHERTIKTMLNRLVRKGALDYETQGNRYLYRPAVTREECISQESRTFLDRVFDGEVSRLLVHFVRNEQLTPAEHRRLRELLQQESDHDARDRN